VRPRTSGQGHNVHNITRHEGLEGE